MSDAVLYGGLDITLSADHILAAYVTNGRSVLGDWSGLELNDYRLRSDGTVYRSSNMPFTGKVLPFNQYTVVGAPAFVYTVETTEDDSNLMQLRSIEGSLVVVGDPVTLPTVIGDAPIYVRNPRDGSLLVSTESQDFGMIWVPSILEGGTSRVLGLAEPVGLPNATQGRPLHVSSVEAVAWMNGAASVLPGGTIPPAQISHFHIDKTTGALFPTVLTPPIEGNFVLNTPLVSSDPDGEGWFITTFEKTAPRTALLRTYRLSLPRDADRDSDGLTDYDEIELGTDIGNPDTDGDGILDGQEVRPFGLVPGEFTWEQARRDVLKRGARLAVLSSADTIESAQLAVGAGVGSSSFWVGAHDLITEGRIQWLNSAGWFKGGPVVGKPSNWAAYQPSNLNNADCMQVGPGSQMRWSMTPGDKIQGYLIQYPVTSPFVADTDGDGLTDGEERTFTSNPTKKDTDNDGLTDKEEKKYGTNPLVKDTDKDGLTDGEEVKKYKTNPTVADTDKDGLRDGDEVALGTNPRKKDTDGDGLNDGDEVKAGTKPLKPDTDGDGLTDGKEVDLGTNPLKKDTDGDGISDYDEVKKGSDPLDKNNPKNIDTDKDGLTDYEELFIYGTDPKKKDTDGDGLSDRDEVRLGTNPLKKDTDGDGVNDYDEVKVTHTNPNTPSFGTGNQGVKIPYGQSTVHGDYEGMVYDPKAGVAFKQTLRLSTSGSFSSQLKGLRRDTSFRGTFSKAGVFTGKPGDAEGVTSVRMEVVKQNSGSYFVQGYYSTRTGGKLYFELRRSAYTNTKTYKKSSKVTFQASLADGSSGPKGVAVATGRIRSNGKTTFSVYLPDGSRSSFSGPVLAGNLIAFYTRSDSGSTPVMLGSLQIRDLKASDFNGTVRLFSAKGRSGTLFPTGFDQERTLARCPLLHSGRRHHAGVQLQGGG